MAVCRGGGTVDAQDSKSCDRKIMRVRFSPAAQQHYSYSKMTIPAFQRLILTWYQEHKRDLPWRNTHNPYNILVSEIMLQQTQVSRVIPKYELFLKTFPTVQDLAKAPDATLLQVWSGLGYWRRAKFLKEAAKVITRDFRGVFPRDTATLKTLPGVGPYTAGAVACFAFNNVEAFIDTNIRRVYLHFFFPNTENVSDAEILTIATQAIPKNDPRNWHWALFDYGATVLKNTKTNRRSKHYAKQSAFVGSFRSYRAKTVKKLLAAPNQTLPSGILLDFLEDELRSDEKDWSAQEVLNALVKDNLIKKERSNYRL